MAEGKIIHHPVDTGWAWVVLLASTSALFLVTGLYRSFGILYVEFITIFDATDAETSAIQAAQNVAYSIGAILTLTVGMELFTCRQCVIAGGILLSLAHGSSSFVGNIQTLYLTYGTFLGFGIALSFSSVMVMVGTYFDKRRGLANGLVMASGSLGTLLLGPGIRYLIDKYTLKGALIIVCGLCTHVVASGAAMRPISFYYKKTKINKEKVKDVEINKSSNDALLNDVIHSETVVYKGAWRDSPIVVRRRSMSESAHNKPIKTYVSDDKLFSLSIADLRVYSNEESESENSENDSCLKNLKKKIVKVFDYRILKRGPFIRMLLAYMAGSLAVSTPIFYLPAYAEEQGLSKQDAAILISIYGCIDVIGRMSAGALSDVGIIKRQYLIGLGLLLNGVTQCLALFYQDFWTFVVYVSLYGLFGGVMPALYVSRLIEMLGLDLLRSGLLLMYMGQGASLGIMSPLIGQLRDATGTYLSCFLLFGSTSILSSFLLWLELIPYFSQKTLSTN